MSLEKTDSYRAKLSKQQKLILRILQEFDGRISRQGLIRRAAEKLGKIDPKEDSIERPENSITNSCRVSISRSIRRLQKRGIVWTDLWTVYLPDKYPGRDANSFS